MRERLEKGVVSTEPLSTRGGTQMANFVNEDGLYDVILDSRKPSARDFRKWVTSEVLPQIRKMGGYIPLHEDDDEKTIMAKAVTILIAHKSVKERVTKLLLDDADVILSEETDERITSASSSSSLVTLTLKRHIPSYTHCV